MTDHIRPKKSLGQNFLKDPHYIRKIADAAAITSGDQVLEIGPGLGHLTRELAARAAKVLSLELDDRLVPVLRKDLAAELNVTIVHADALAYDYGSLPGTWKTVANLPYYISTPILQRLVAARGKFTSLTLMLQREVAERITASPDRKAYGYLSVLVQLYTDPRIEFLVPSGAFTPQPDVDSAVATLVVRDRPAADVRDEALLVRVVKTAFSQRRKMLSNTLRQLGLSKDAVEQALKRAGIAPRKRAENLSVQEFCVLSDMLSELPDIQRIN